MGSYLKAFLVSVSMAMLATMPETARAQEKPDFGRAYKLAAASYSVYAVEDLEADYGRARAPPAHAPITSKNHASRARPSTELPNDRTTRKSGGWFHESVGTRNQIASISL